MKLYSWNVNGIRAVVNKGAFQAFIAQEKPDILGLQETIDRLVHHSHLIIYDRESWRFKHSLMPQK